MALAMEPRARVLDAEPVMIDVETARTAQQALAHSVARSRGSSGRWPVKHQAALRALYGGYCGGG